MVPDEGDTPVPLSRVQDMGDPQSTTLALICAYCGASDLSTTLVDAPGGLVTAAQAAARSSPVGAQLLGESPEQQAQVRSKFVILY